MFYDFFPKNIRNKSTTKTSGNLGKRLAKPINQALNKSFQHLSQLIKERNFSNLVCSPMFSSSMCNTKTNRLKETRVTRSMKKQGGRGHWAIYFTSPQIFIVTFSYSLA